MQACNRCHARKTRCDRRIPQCSACEKAGCACLHVDKVRQRQLPRGHVDSMEAEIRKLNNENQALRRELAALRREPRSGEECRSDSNEGDNNNGEINPASVSQAPPQNAQGASPDVVRSTVVRSSTEGSISAEVGYLTLKATGETSYLGSSSGVGLASIIDSVVKSQSGILPPENNESHTKTVTSAAVDAPLPPPLSVAMPIIEAYFQHTHIMFPLLHRPEFLRAVDQIYGEAGYRETHPYECFVFDMVLAIGSSNVNRFEESTAGTAAHYGRAQSNLQHILGLKGLLPLKAILLLSQHGIFSNLRDTSPSMWHLVGIGVRMCFEMGLHLEPKAASSSGRLGARYVTMEEELRRRCFWCLYNLDRIVSFTLGRPAGIRDSDIDVCLPSHLDDDLFGPENPIPHPLPDQDTGSSPFLHLIRIRRLSGEIHATFYSGKQDARIPLEEKLLVRREIHEKLISWKEDTERLALVEAQSNQASFVSCFVTREWYSAVFNNAILLLYRPSPYLPQPKILTGFENEGGDQLFAAAKATIAAYANLHQKRRLNYSWITLHGVFMAGLAYVYGVGRSIKDAGQTMPIPDYLDIINDTRACSNVLVAICERWNVSRGSSELFNKLSSAVIRDAVNAATKREANSNNITSSQVQVNSGRRSVATVDAQGGGNQQQFNITSDMEMLNNIPHLVDHVSVIDEFRQYASAFETDFSGEQSFPSELVTGFSQDWNFDDHSSHHPGDDYMQIHPNLW